MDYFLEQVGTLWNNIANHHEHLRQRANLRSKVKNELKAHKPIIHDNHKNPFIFEQIKELSDLPKYIYDEKITDAEYFFFDETEKNRNVFYSEATVFNDTINCYQNKRYMLSSDADFYKITRKEDFGNIVYSKKQGLLEKIFDIPIY